MPACVAEAAGRVSRAGSNNVGDDNSGSSNIGNRNQVSGIFGDDGTPYAV